ncbi:MAG: hypothetical protein NZM25_10875 [Leptospiraceae bacterium]|nr:hypothetical protein [Leptospiraceae bacterium]MDW8305932.1 hypothetical protein [Leptospiraceae bacterium]
MEDFWNKERVRRLGKLALPPLEKEVFVQEVLYKLRQKRDKVKKPWCLRPLISPLQLALVLSFLLVLSLPFMYSIYELRLAPREVESQRMLKVSFTYTSKEALLVELLGDFNGWQRGVHVLQPVAPGKYQLELYLPPGRYQYIFLVNGYLWQQDPGCPERVDDGFGHKNSLLVL